MTFYYPFFLISIYRHWNLVPQLFPVGVYIAVLLVVRGDCFRFNTWPALAWLVGYSHLQIKAMYLERSKKIAHLVSSTRYNTLCPSHWSGCRQRVTGGVFVRDKKHSLLEYNQGCIFGKFSSMKIKIGQKDGPHRPFIGHTKALYFSFSPPHTYSPGVLLSR